VNPWRPRHLAGALLLMGLALMPLTASAYLLSFMFLLFMYVTMAESWNMLSGYTGYFSLGHGLFFGVGAYAFALLVLKGKLSPYAAILAGGAVAVLLAAALGYPLMRARIRAAYFAILTLGLNEIMKTMIGNNDALGASYGFTLPPVPHQAVPYYALLMISLGAIGVMAAVDRSRFGLGLRAILEDEEVAESSGVDTARYKMGVFMLSAWFPGLAGGVIAWNWSYIDPYLAFDLLLSFNSAIMAVFGGVGTVWGPVVGAVVMSLLIEALWINLPHFQAVVFGLLVIVIILVSPGGVVELAKRFSSARWAGGRG